MMKKVHLATLVAITLMATGAMATAAAASSSTIIPPQQQNYGQLGALWWKWALSIPYTQNPIFDTTGADCAVGQNGGRWFLAGTPGGILHPVLHDPRGREDLLPGHRHGERLSVP